MTVPVLTLAPDLSLDLTTLRTVSTPALPTVLRFHCDLCLVSFRLDTFTRSFIQYSERNVWSFCTKQRRKEEYVAEADNNETKFHSHNCIGSNGEETII